MSLEKKMTTSTCAESALPDSLARHHHAKHKYRVKSRSANYIAMFSQEKHRRRTKLRVCDRHERHALRNHVRSALSTGRVETSDDLPVTTSSIRPCGINPDKRWRAHRFIGATKRTLEHCTS